MFNTAFNFVGEQWQPGDRVMTEHPSAAYVYLEQNDYYANQVTAKVLDDVEENLLIDRYTASPLIDTVDKKIRRGSADERLAAHPCGGLHRGQ